ncbi:heavy metal translocating P-type ATPase [Vasconcelosia minhoensis]|nr:heavy metal translocating P-type ATPase [Romeria gracilis]
MTTALNLPDPLKRLTQAFPDAVAVVICAILLLLGWLSLHLGWIGIGVWVLLAAYAIGGYDSAREGLTTLFRERELDVDLLMIVAALGAAGLGLWRQEYHLLIDGGILILIFAISGALESIAMRRTERSIRALMSLTPETARVVTAQGEQTRPIRQVRLGDRVLVKPGERVPLDGLIRSGSSTLNEASITGESVPVEKATGDEVFAGTLNGSGALALEVHTPPESNLIQRIIQLVEQAQQETPPSQQFIERFERGYARVIVVVGLMLAVLPPLAWAWSWETTIYRALIFLVVASPCALMAAIMPTLLAGIANGARQGILFKDGAQLELLGQVKAIAFDKTGTLTTGQLQVSQVIPSPGQTAAQVLQVAASLEAYSEHPIGAAIVGAADSALLPVDNPQAVAGRGITGQVAGLPTRVGRIDLTQGDRISYGPELDAAREQLESQGQTVVWVLQQEQVLGLIAVADEVRSQSQAMVQRMRSLGIQQTVLLTGDNPRTADSVAQAVGIDRVYAQLLPEDKVKVIKQLQQQYDQVAMVGDGINDAPALAQATVGIAMGGTGSDVALETADIVLMANRLDRLEAAIQIGRRSQRIVKQNIVFALTVIGLLLIANFAGGINLPAGVVGHEGSTLLVTLNGLRLLRR